MMSYFPKSVPFFQWEVLRIIPSKIVSVIIRNIHIITVGISLSQIIFINGINPLQGIFILSKSIFQVLFILSSLLSILQVFKGTLNIVGISTDTFLSKLLGTCHTTTSCHIVHHFTKDSSLENIVLHPIRVAHILIEVSHLSLLGSLGILTSNLARVCNIYSMSKCFTSLAFQGMRQIKLVKASTSTMIGTDAKLRVRASKQRSNNMFRQLGRDSVADDGMAQALGEWHLVIIAHS